MVNVDIKQLAIFAFWRKKHFAQTATAFHLTPSAVTRSIQKLEQALSVTLFERNSKQVELTPSAEELLTFALPMLEEWRQLTNQLQANQVLQQGEITLFSSVTATYTILPNLFDVFRQQFPFIEIHLSTGDQAQALDKVRAQECDLAVTARPAVMGGDIAFKTLTYSPLRFIMPVASGQGQVTRLIQQQVKQRNKLDYAALPLIVAERGLVKERLMQWFQSQQVKPTVSAVVSGHEAIISMVALGCGVGLVPEIVLQNSPLKNKVAMIESAPELTPLAIGLCALKDRVKEMPMANFWQVATAIETFEER